MKKVLVLLVFGLLLGVAGKTQNTFMRFYSAAPTNIFNDVKVRLMETIFALDI